MSRVDEIFAQLDWDNRKRENDTRLEDAICDLFGWIEELSAHLNSDVPQPAPLDQIRDELVKVGKRLEEIES